MAEPKLVRIEKPSFSQYNAQNDKDVNFIGRRIAQARKDRGWSLVVMSKKLEDFGVHISSGALNKWETGVSAPSSYQLMAIAHLFDMRNMFIQFSSSYIPCLSQEGRKKVLEYEELLIGSGLYMSDELFNETYVNMPVSCLRVSAGSGQWLDEDSFETQSFPKSSVPAGADFGVRVRGDSMEPVFHNDQIVWVRKCTELAAGDVGIFIYDGDGYIKVYNEQLPEEEDAASALTDCNGSIHKQPIMVSYNCRYRPILVSPEIPFHIIGKVIS